MAIENKYYEAIAGCVGNLPKVDIQYGLSAVFWSSYFAFPYVAIVSETTTNTEIILIVDLYLDRFIQLHNDGSVRNYLDRRAELYKKVSCQVSWRSHFCKLVLTLVVS